MGDEPEFIVDPRLKEWATARQKEVIDAVNREGGFRAAARFLKIGHNAVHSTINSLTRRARVQGYDPEHDMTHPAPSPYVVKGTSTLYDKDGKTKLQWVKTRLDAAKAEEAIREFVASLVDEARGLLPPTPAPGLADSDLLSLYGFGDPHFGMYAWAEEAGESFDLAEAERLTRGAIDRLVACAPPSEVGLLLNIGDFFHGDDSSNQTPGHGHALDIDTRHAKVMQVGLRAMVYAIRRLAEKHQKVIAWMMPGNHDPHSSFALALCLAAFFENEPRVQVDLSPSLYKYLRFGKVLIGAHHGHTAKMNDLPLIMATDRSEDWGATQHRYWYGGHIHHLTKKEFPGVVFETLRTLAPRDAWHAGAGYRAGRDAQLIIHHKDFGELERHRVDAAMLPLAAGAATDG